jgi:hypothetical protein
MRSTCLGLLLLVVAANSAKGAIMTVDYLSSGDGLITRDLDNELDWLDWTYTNGASYNQFALRLLSGGDLEGWRLATTAEALALLVSAEVPSAYVGSQYYPLPVADLTNLDLLATALGKTGVEGGSGNFTGAILADTSAPGFSHDFFQINLGAGNVYGAANIGGVGDNNGSVNAGFALVRNAPAAGVVPEPATITIWAVGVLASFAAIWRKPKRG